MYYMTYPLHCNDEAKSSLENTSHTDIPQLEQNLMSLPEFTPYKVKRYKNDTFCKNIIPYIDCSKHNNYFIEAS